MTTTMSKTSKALSRINRYLSHLKISANALIQTRTITNYKSSSEQNMIVRKYIKHIKKINDEQIRKHNYVISRIVHDNIDNNFQTACGPYANALLNIMPKLKLSMNPLNPQNLLTSLKMLTSSKSFNPLNLFNPINLLNPPETIYHVSIDLIHDALELINNSNTHAIFAFKLFSDCDLIHDENKNENENKNVQQINFPGHAFAIIKIYKDEFIFTQSYVDEYSHKDCVLRKNYEEIIVIINAYVHIIKSRFIDDKFIEMWQQLTGINVNDWKNNTCHKISYAIHSIFF